MLNQLINDANEYMKQFQSINCYCIIENTNNDYVEKFFKETGYNIKYDVVYFNSFDEFKNFIERKISYDYIDNAQRLNDDEKIIYVFAKNKIIIM